MARSQYIYSLNGAYNTVVWIGAVKHELVTYIQRNMVAVSSMRVRRYRDGARTGEFESVPVEQFRDQGWNF